MSFDAPIQPQRIAIIGGGISGLAAAYEMSPHHAITLYEAAPTLGGHARTVIAGKRGDQPVDTGFIVFNYANYPHLTAMFRDLNVPVERSDMSFGATIDGGAVEYGLQGLRALIGQRRNLLRPGFYRMVRDIMRFNARAEAAARDDDMSIGDLLDQLGLGDWFVRYYLLPISGAIWSTPPEDIRDFPARALVQFFRNHALLSTSGQHQWWTVKGGSIQYINRLERHLEARACILHRDCPVTSVARGPEGVTIRAQGRAAEVFDQVIFACHSDEALRLLDAPAPDEAAALSAIRYQDNHMVLHCDAGQMPKRRDCWSSWVYKADSRDARGAIGVTYWMNKLQNIPLDDPLFVTLNPATPIAADKIYDQKLFRHPVFDGPALRAQKQLTALQGRDRLWFAGAYTRHGFHEDGYASAVRIARAMARQPV